MTFSVNLHAFAKFLAAHDPEGETAKVWERHILNNLDMYSHTLVVEVRDED